VQPNRMRMLRALGMGAAVEQGGALIHSWSFCDQQGEVLCETGLQALWGDVETFVGIERGSTSLERAPRRRACSGRHHPARNCSAIQSALSGRHR
jgi:hypothetical protein